MQIPLEHRKAQEQQRGGASTSLATISRQLAASCDQAPGSCLGRLEVLQTGDQIGDRLIIGNGTANKPAGP